MSRAPAPERVEVTLLGVGSSGGTPALGCDCPTCTSHDPRNTRTRTSAVFSVGGRHLLIDTGPDLRQQALREQIMRLDAVLYTHPHADHIHGIDDLRAWCWLQKGALPVYGNQLTLEHIKSRFTYTLLSPNEYWDKPVLTLHEVERESFVAGGVRVQPVPLLHGKWPILGFRVGNVAFLTDVSAVPEESFALLERLDVLILDCLREREHPTHLSVAQSLALARRIGARRTVLIHMTHELEYHALGARLPPGVEVGYDGMRLHGGF
ncbi:MBL fold metallo-hydrolase [Chitiniphilus eburneus]|uniref:MBL fold metallo-hydrolase n=1 Tax=Chitiniphilus eburneus TaxID=2571148 RepID=A0A4U0Q1H7_9NEIS|nr:MBL fold metallo-hydrolase [Chitiniphilus eburneus]TJZ74759.1 MBL fold metallo-hydrolase [Chitiniphilus eburneus]